MSFLELPSRYLFFTGKGGVGKTALACATSIRLADAGNKTLLVSTDPASNLDQMLGVSLTNHPTPVPGVTLAETTPVSEAAQLQADLRRARIEPYAWIINSSLAAAGSHDPLLQQRIAAELAQIEAVKTQHAKRVGIVPWMTEEPVGPERLLRLARFRGPPL